MTFPRSFGEPPPRPREEVHAIIWQFTLVGLAGAVVGVALAAISRSVIPLFAIFVWIFCVQAYFQRKYPDTKNARWWD
jgi:uncharacterized membrane protein YfcA